ncbi:hypothetical protein BSKO_13085 [Bryopsis sp. KO-2023]|nr:hypothetical protein BSKO_13085 [Bryopsis sp. KO-2023]
MERSDSGVRFGRRDLENSVTSALPVVDGVLHDQFGDYPMSFNGGNIFSAPRTVADLQQGMEASEAKREGNVGYSTAFQTNLVAGPAENPPNPAQRFSYQAGDEVALRGKSSAESGSTSGTRRRKSVPAELDASAETKQKVIQEKNRLAQRRFRERQKAKVQDLHTQIEDLKAKVDALEFENSARQSQNRILEKVLAMRDEQIHVMQDENRILDLGGKEDGEKSCTITLTALKGQPVKITCEMLKKMSPEEVMQLWQTYVTEISAALVDANSNNPGALGRIERLTNEICLVCMRFSILNPISSKVWHARQYHMSEGEELKRWKTITATLDMTRDQKVEVMQLRRILLRKLQQLVEERRKLNLTIQTSLPSSTVGHKITLEYLKANQAVVRLKEILRAEHNAMLDFVCTTIKKVLEPLQVARLMVQAYPIKPDLLAVASAVASELGEDISVLPPTETPPIVPIVVGAPDPFRPQGVTLFQATPFRVGTFPDGQTSLNQQPDQPVGGGNDVNADEQ